MNNFASAIASTSTDWTLMKPIILTASIIGCVQGLIWTILSIIPIVIYNGKFKVYEETLGLYTDFIYNRLLSEATIPDKYVMQNYVFNVFMFFYLVISFCWFINSCFLFYATVNDMMNHVKNGTISWTILTFITSALDIITMSMFVSDYISLKEDMDGTWTNEIMTLYLTCYGIMMTAAARGYVLWVVNVAFAIILAYFARNMLKQTNVPRRSLINAYGASPRAFSLYQETDIGQGKANESFQDDENILPRNHPEERSNLSNYPNFQKNDLNGYKFQTAPENRFAHIGKPTGGQRLPSEQHYPQNAPYKLGHHSYGNIAPSPVANNPPIQPVPQQNTNPNMPYIPNPDYSPPNSPKGQHRSVLRSTSRYA